jgi:hypothetical protein
MVNEIFLNFATLMSEIKENKLKRPNICNAVKFMQRMTYIFIITLHNIIHIYKYTLCGLVMTII